MLQKKESIMRITIKIKTETTCSYSWNYRFSHYICWCNRAISVPIKCIHCICNIACFNINGELSLCIRNQLWIITIENCFQFGVRVGFLEFYWKFLVFTINISRVGFNKALHVKPHKMTTNHTDRKITTQKFYSVCDFHHMEPGPFKPPVDAWIGEQHTQCTNTIDDTLVVDIGGDYKHTQCFMSKLTSFSIAWPTSCSSFSNHMQSWLSRGNSWSNWKLINIELESITWNIVNSQRKAESTALFKAKAFVSVWKKIEWAPAT